MASNYVHRQNQDTEVHFSEALFGEVEQSRMTATPCHLTTLNAGDLVPIYCREILPHERLSIDLDFVLRQTTLQTPTMGNMIVDYYAFFVPNRVVNKSFKAVMGENYNGAWTGNPISLATLKFPTGSEVSTVIPVGSVADYYGFPTQRPMPNSVLEQCHDLKFRGYVMIWNEYFRDQNYQPPIPMSTLNVYQGFMDPADSVIPLNGSNSQNSYVLITSNTQSDGSFGAGSISNELYGSAGIANDTNQTRVAPRSSINSFRALDKPLKVNKLHDYFTSCLPSPQKSLSSVLAPVSGSLDSINVVTSSVSRPLSSAYPLFLRTSSTGAVPPASTIGTNSQGYLQTESSTGFNGTILTPTNLVTESGASVTGLALDIKDIRMAAAIQQVYEALGRGGSRYREYLRSFFGLDVDDPFDDIPKRLGWIRRSLDLYQTAQTSASESGNTPQGNLAAFGYTANGGKLFDDVTFLEHGYLHIFAVVRHKNIYPSFMARDNFRLNMLDFYQPQLCNISEQPVYQRELNPFGPNPENGIGYQEAWAEYRYEPDYVTGLMRPGVDGSLALWNYADEFDSGIQVIDSSFLQSNSEEVLNRTLAVTSALAPQFKLAVRFKVDKTLPMTTYSVPGMDII